MNTASEIENGSGDQEKDGPDNKKQDGAGGQKPNDAVQQEQDKEARKRKRKFKRRLIWLGLHVVSLTVILILLLYKPGSYDPQNIIESGKVSPYLTNVLAPQFYNGSQLRKPFDVVVTQEGINDIVLRYGWPKQSGEAEITDPSVLFSDDGIVLMGKVLLKGVELVVTVVVAPQIDDEGLIKLHVSAVRVGVMNVTPLARATAKQMYQQQVELMGSGNDWRSQVMGSLLNDESFDPVFKIDKNRVRIERVTIEQEKLVLRVVPAGD